MGKKLHSCTLIDQDCIESSRKSPRPGRYEETLCSANIGVCVINKGYQIKAFLRVICLAEPHEH